VQTITILIKKINSTQGKLAVYIPEAVELTTQSFGALVKPV